MSSDDFLENIKTEDDEIKDMLQSNISRWLVPRYVASYKKYNGKMVASVGLQFVSKDSELWNTKGTANKVLIHTSQRTPIDSAPHIIQSPGAWVQKTAASVRADLLYLLNGTSLFTHN
jgi:homoserine dehydrogenase